MGWRRVTFSSEQLVRGAGLRLHEEFKLAFIALGAPRQMVLASRGLRPGGDVEFYFSPETATLAGPIIAKYAATECSPPDRMGLRHEIGHDGVLDELLQS